MVFPGTLFFSLKKKGRCLRICCLVSYVYRKPLNRRWVMNRNEHICNVHFNVSQLSASKSLFIVEKMKLSSKIRRRLCWCCPYVRERYIETSAVIFISQSSLAFSFFLNYKRRQQQSLGPSQRQHLHFLINL